MLRAVESTKSYDYMKQPTFLRFVDVYKRIIREIKSTVNIIAREAKIPEVKFILNEAVTEELLNISENSGDVYIPVHLFALDKDNDDEYTLTIIVNKNKDEINAYGQDLLRSKKSSPEKLQKYNSNEKIWEDISWPAYMGVTEKEYETFQKPEMIAERRVFEELRSNGLMEVINDDEFEKILKKNEDILNLYRNMYQYTEIYLDTEETGTFYLSSKKSFVEGLGIRAVNGVYYVIISIQDPNNEDNQIEEIVGSTSEVGIIEAMLKVAYDRYSDEEGYFVYPLSLETIVTVENSTQSGTKVQLYKQGDPSKNPNGTITLTGDEAKWMYLVSLVHGFEIKTK